MRKEIVAAMAYMQHKPGCKIPRGDQFCRCGMSQARLNLETAFETQHERPRELHELMNIPLDAAKRNQPK